MAPVLLPGTREYLDAFLELSTDRPAGFSILPIPAGAIAAFAERIGLGEADEFETFRRLIRAMDAVLMDHVRAKDKQPQEADK